MGIYDNETKIYPDLNTSASQETEAYQLKKLTEIEVFFLDEVEFRERIAIKMKRFNTITSIMDTGLVTSMVVALGISTAAFTSGFGLPVGNAYFFPLQQSSHENLLKPLP